MTPISDALRRAERFIASWKVVPAQVNLVSKECARAPYRNLAGETLAYVQQRILENLGAASPS